MSRRVTLVIDGPDRKWLDGAELLWLPHELSRDLVKAGASESSVFTGRLEEAPESWAYLLFTINGELTERGRHPVAKQRLAKTLAAETNPMEVCRIAEKHELLGTLDRLRATWFGPNRAKSGAVNALTVKRALAPRLGWELHTLNSTPNYAMTTAMPQPLPQLIMKYLIAALEPPTGETRRP